MIETVEYPRLFIVQYIIQMIFMFWKFKVKGTIIFIFYNGGFRCRDTSFLPTAFTT